MLQSMRNSLRTAGKGILGFFLFIMIIPMVFFGLDSGFGGSSNEGVTVASVNGEDIKEAELNRVIQAQRNEFTQRFGANLPQELISDEALRGPSLEAIIRRNVIVQSAIDGDMMIAPSVTAELIQTAPAFQEGGRYSEERYRQYAFSQGYTPSGFRQNMAQEFLVGQYKAGYEGTGFITEKNLRRIVELTNQKRSFYSLVIPLAPREANMTASDEEAQTYFDENQAKYQKPGDVTIEYIELDKAKLEANIDVTEEELLAAYEEEKVNFRVATERRVAHILITEADDAANKVSAVQARLAEGADFTALAAEFSDDFGSKNDGGDLGYIAEADDYFPAEFMAALPGLSIDQVSGPVVTEEGTHFIKVLDTRGAEPPTFEERRSILANQLRSSRATQEFQDLSIQLGDESYSATSLAEVEEKLDLPVQVVGPFTRSGGLGFANNPAVLDAAFSDDVMTDGNTSKLLQLGPNRVAVLRVIKQNPARPYTFEEVKDQVLAEVKTEKAKAEVATLAETLAAEVRAGKSVEEVAKANELEWEVALDVDRRDPAQRREVLSHAFSLPKHEVSASQALVSTVEANNGDYAVVQLTAVSVGDFDAMAAAEKSALRRRLASQMGIVEYGALQTSLVADADVDRRN